MMILGGTAPTCALCRRPVRQLRIEDHDPEGPIRVIVLCCGQQEAIEIPRDVFAAAETFEWGTVFADRLPGHVASSPAAALHPAATALALPAAPADAGVDGLALRDP